MDDYRDLVIVGLALVCAGIMLVAGQLYIERRGTYPPGIQVGSPQKPQERPALISRARQPHENTNELQEGTNKNPAG